MKIKDNDFTDNPQSSDISKAPRQPLENHPDQSQPLHLLYKGMERAEIERLKAVIDAMPSAVVLVEASTGRISYINQRALELYGIDYVGASLDDHFAKVKARKPDGSSYPPEEWPISHSLTFGKAVRNEEMIIEAADGVQSHVLVSSSPLLDDQGKVVLGIAVFEDITKRKQAENRSNAAHRQVQGIIDNATSIIYALDLEERFLLVNTALAKLLNSTPEQMIGKRRHEFMPKEDADWHEANDRQVIETGAALEFEEFSRLKGRSITWLTTKFPLHDAQGRIHAVGGISTDITERKQAQEALRLSEKRYRSLFSCMTEGFALHEIITDAEGRPVDYRFLEVNPSFEKLTELKRNDLIGHRVLDVLPGTEPHWIEKYGRVAISGEPVHFENYSAVLGRWYQVYAYQTDPMQFATIFKDITERKQAEAALRESEALYRAIAHNFPDGAIYVFGHDLRFRIADGQALATLGYSREDLEGKTIWESTDEGTYRILEQRYPRVLKGETHHFETTLKGRFFSSNYLPIKDKLGNVIAGMEVSHDITERKRTEQALRESEKRLKRLNEALDQRVEERTRLAELRTKQLHTLAMEVIEAEEREKRKIAALLHEDLQQMLASARFQVQSVKTDVSNESLLEHVSQILEEAMTKSRRLSHELSPPVLQHIDLTAAFEWLANQLGEQFGIQVQLEADRHPQVENDSIKVFLFRAVQELLFNAIKHGGVKTVRVQLSEKKGDLAITVSDQGKGFDPSILDNFEAKSGIGLFGIRERASHIGGRLEVESAPGKGSRFCLTAPASHFFQEEIKETEKLSMKAVDSPSEVSDTGRLQLVIADDHKVMRQGLISLISSHPDIEVAGEAADGREAVELAKQCRPDVIIMDISMPVMDGMEATRHIKAAQPEVRVIGLSMHEDEEIFQEMRAAGADEFLSKGASAAELLKAIYGGSKFKRIDQ